MINQEEAKHVLLALAGAAMGATASSAQDQPIKRTELIGADVADVPGKETVIYFADVMPGGRGYDASWKRVRPYLNRRNNHCNKKKACQGLVISAPDLR